MEEGKEGGEAKKGTAPKKAGPKKAAPKKGEESVKQVIQSVYELSKRIESLENRLSQIEKSLRLKTAKEIQLSQLEFDDLVYQNYLEIRERPKQPASLAKVWQEINNKEDISWEDFSKMILKSQDPRFHLVEGKADKVVEDKQNKRYYSNLIGK